MAAKRDRGKPWSVNVYLAGDNDLSEEMVWSLQEMSEAARMREIREAMELRVLYDPAGGAPLRYDFTDLRAYSGEGSRGLASRGVKDPSLPATERSADLVEAFLLGTIARVPAAASRAVVLSGHGSGAVGDFLPDREPAGGLSIPVLGRILRDAAGRAGAKIDVLGLDTCQMSTIEVGFEVRDSVGHLIASEGPVSNTGWPYRQVLEGLVARSGDGAAAAARSIAERYLEFYRDYELAPLSSDIAVVDLSKLDEVASAVRELTSAIREPLSRIAPDGLEEKLELESGGASEDRAVRNAVVLAHWSAQSYKGDRYSDLYDFTEQLLRFLTSGGAAAERIRSSAERLLESLRRAAIFSGTTGPELQHSHGLSIYFPWSARDFSPEYRYLRFAEETGWADLLGVYFAATLRMRRGQAEHMKNGEPEEPHRSSDVSAVLALGDGTRDAEAGTRRGSACRSTMKNPPDGYYRRGE